MKCQFCIIALLYCTIAIAACTGPVIIDDDNENKNEEIHSRDSVPVIHEGTYTSPYSIGEAQTVGRGRNVWIEGYIVGCVKGSMKSGCNYTAEATTTANILLADTFPSGSEQDYLSSLPVELPSGDLRDLLNLYDNPENYHRKVCIQGNLTLYYSVVGMKDTSDYIFTDETNYEPEEKEPDKDDKEEKPEEPNKPHDPDATRQDTLSIAEGIKLQSEDEYNQVSIRGYIVGYAKGNNSVVYMDSTMVMSDRAYENVVLADNINERDNTKIIVVALPKGYIRNDVNLIDNPQNLHKRLTVTGHMIPYYGLAGCKETLGKENRELFLLE